jgi:hypothetical protein
MLCHTSNHWSHRNCEQKFTKISGNNTRITLNRFPTKTVILGTSHIIRKVLQAETWSLSGGVHHWLKKTSTREERKPVTRNDDNNNNNNTFCFVCMLHTNCYTEHTDTIKFILNGFSFTALRTSSLTKRNQSLRCFTIYIILLYVHIQEINIQAGLLCSVIIIK